MTLFQKPIFYYDNALRRAKEGDDGTDYATLSKAVRHPADDNAVLCVPSLILDLGSNYSALLGMALRMATSGNPYRITGQADISAGPPRDDNYTAIAFDGEAFCLFFNSSGADPDKCYTSPDSFNWTERTLVTGGEFQGICSHNGGFAAVAAGGETCALSTDHGASWSNKTMSAGKAHYMIASNGLSLCATQGGPSNKCSYSTNNGTTWAEGTMPAIREWRGICASGSRYIAVAGGTDKCAVSDDNGATWAEKTLPASRSWWEVRTNGVVIVAIAYGPTDKCAISTDNGDTWSEKTLPISADWYGIEANDGIFVALATAGVSTTGAISTNNGNTWSAIAPPVLSGTYHRAICAGLGMFVSPNYTSGSGSHIVRSYDGLYWPTRSLTLHERFQDADVNDAATVRAGLACAQQDTSAVVDKAADEQLAPVMKGLVNTELKLRAHLPNMVLDGGCESGVITTSGPAGANWSVESAAALEGAKSFKWDTAANNNKIFTGQTKLLKGKTYTVLCKVQSVTGDAAADVLELQIKNIGTGTNVYSAITGNKPAITTTAAWKSFNITPDFDTDRWELIAVPALANKGAATAILLDEVYVYEPISVLSLLVGRHNWTARGPVKVNAWRCSPLRSTASIGGGDGVELASFTCESPAVIEQALTENAYPIFELVIPAAAAWTPEIGELYIGGYWQSPRWFKGPFNPYKTDEGNRRVMKVNFGGLPAILRSTVEALFDVLRSNGSIWVKHNTDPPLLMEAKDRNFDAPQDSDRIDFDADLIEKI